MKHKEDIYRKPRKFLSEYFAGVLAMIVVSVFLAFELFSFTSSKSDAILLALQTQKDLQESNLPKAVVVDDQADKFQEKSDATTEKDEQIKSVYDSESLTKTEQNESGISKARDLIASILKTTDETLSWKLQESFTAYSQEDIQKLLDHAIENNHVENLKKMLKTGYKLATPYYMGNANKLISSRKYDIVFFLIEQGLLDVKKANQYGYTLLHEASAKGHSELVRLLVSKGLDINSQSRSGASALHYPTRYGFGITVTTLIQLGIDPNLKVTLNYPGFSWNQTTALHIAVKRGHNEIVKKLLESGADPLMKDGNGMSPLDIAKQLQKEDLVLLLEVKKSPDDNNEESMSSDLSVSEDNNMTDTEKTETPSQEDMADESINISDSNITENDF